MDFFIHKTIVGIYSNEQNNSQCKINIRRMFWINIISSNGLLPDSAKPLPEPMEEVADAMEDINYILWAITAGSWYYRGAI